MSRFMASLIAVTGLGFTHLAFKRHSRHHDAAFNQMMWEIWKTPNVTVTSHWSVRNVT